MECRLQQRSGRGADWSADQLRFGTIVQNYLGDCTRLIRETFAGAVSPPSAAPADDVVDAIVRVLLRPEFFYQPAGRVAHLLIPLRERIAAVVRDGRPIPIYFLYHGGYRSSSCPDRPDLVFTPDATELLLLYQAARLQARIRAVYPPGIAFAVVINNGVAAYTNGIAYPSTEAYVRRLQCLIAALGAGGAVWVLMQSSLGDFDAAMRSVAIVPAATLADAEHRIVERFLGRPCSPVEAGERAARYVAAENAWAVQLGELIDAASGIFLRQVSHPACLSFRPFPGGAIRAQNGEVGFRMAGANDRPVPFLISDKVARARPILNIPVDLSAIVPGGFAAA